MSKIEPLKFESSRRIEPHLNRRLRMITNKLNEIVDAINSGAEVKAEAVEEVAEAVAQTVVEPAPVMIDAATEITADSAQPFDWANSEDEPVLVEYAKSIGIKCDARVTINSVKKKIAQTIGVAE